LHCISQTFSCLSICLIRRRVWLQECVYSLKNLRRHGCRRRY